MKLTDFFFRNATFFWTCVVMIVFSGIYAYIIMPKLEDPELSVKQAMVVTYYPGLLHTKSNSKLHRYSKMNYGHSVIFPIWNRSLRKICQLSLSISTWLFRSRVSNNVGIFFVERWSQPRNGCRQGLSSSGGRRCK